MLLYQDSINVDVKSNVRQETGISSCPLSAPRLSQVKQRDEESLDWDHKEAMRMEKKRREDGFVQKKKTISS